MHETSAGQRVRERRPLRSQPLQSLQPLMRYEGWIVNFLVVEQICIHDQNIGPLATACGDRRRSTEGLCNTVMLHPYAIGRISRTAPGETRIMLTPVHHPRSNGR